MSSRNESGDGRDRRQFLKEAGAALGLGWALPVLTACESAEALQGHGSGPTGTHLGLAVDVEKCQREPVRRAAIEACHRTHNVPEIPETEDEVKWIWETEFERAFPEQVHDQTPAERRHAPVLVACNHCERPPCVRVCPTQATWKRESDGIVMMDMHRCIGCRYCIAACPYGARSFNWRDPRPFIPTDENGDFPSDFPTRTRGVVEKCNLCAERLKDGLRPACVEAAESVEPGALVFGDVSDPDSEISRVLHERSSVVRRPELGTGPKVYYIV
jgi:molybdopterin-containing oxidoreductase family iron-sulfur binding subunit